MPVRLPPCHYGDPSGGILKDINKLVKKCGTCRKEKSFNLFYPKLSRHPKYATSPAGFSSDCRECVKEARAEYVRLNPDKCKASDRGYHVNKYGITLIDYNSMFSSQGGCCLGCNRHQTELNRRLSIDHDHETGKVRGLLCISCNVILGQARDNKQVLLNLINYLKTNSESADKTDVGNLISLRK